MLLQHRHISSSNRNDEEKNINQNENFHLYFCVIMCGLKSEMIKKEKCIHLQNQPSNSISMP